jgi:hypothetical protein
MKRFLATGLALVVLLISNLALADPKDHRGNNGRGHNKFEARHNDRDYNRYYYDNRYSRRDYDDNDVSISLHFGTVAPRPFGYNTYGYNMLGYRPAPRPRQPVIIYQNNTYIDPAPSYSGSCVTRRTNRQGVSLLRDSSGRCFERYRDGRGNETRTELPASECNF